MMSEILRLENVIKMYDNGRRAINGVSFAINEHESVCVYGVCGSGRTTLIKLIAGIEAPSEGSVIVDSEEVHPMNADEAADFRNRTFGFLPRNPGFMDALPMRENIALPLAIRKVPAEERNKAVSEQMKTLGIAHLAGACPPQLSSLELQLASVARALSTSPKILLMDEMDAHLAQKEQKKVHDLLYLIRKSGELTMIRFTDRDNVNDAWPYDRRFRLEYGKIMKV
jgi:putative ABC transport system ATP-binding protein